MSKKLVTKIAVIIAGLCITVLLTIEACKFTSKAGTRAGVVFNQIIPKEFSVEESMERFNGCERMLDLLVKEYGYQLEQGIIPDDTEGIGKAYYVQMEDNKELSIVILNVDGIESFYVQIYGDKEPKMEVSLDKEIPFFLAVVNSISGKPISREICESVIDEGKKNELTGYTKELDFLKNYEISYEEYSLEAGVEIPMSGYTLGAGGLVKK